MKLWRGLFLLAIAFLIASIAARALPVSRVNDAAVLGAADSDGASYKFPRTLSQFGFFQDAAGREPGGDLIAYKLNTPLYSDGADKLRYLYVPEGQKIAADGDSLLQLPVGSAIIKTFAFGAGADQRYIETRVLLHRADGWLALPYQWNAEQTEAKLAVAGARMPLTRPDGVEVSYRIPNKNQCKSCHSKDGEVIPIGPKVRNLSADLLAKLEARGFLAAATTAARPLPVWSTRADNSDTEGLARAYLDVNCAHCHQPGGAASNSGLDLRWEQSSAHDIGIAKPPVAAGRGAGGHAVSIAPGDPDASIMVYRMSSTEPGIAMPELGRSTNDDEGIAIVRKWIAEMAPHAKASGEPAS
ncbi:MAG: SO2930 family diheme c-type cytochrome [Erythrobacter sp.]